VIVLELIYVPSSDSTGSVIIDANVTHDVGQALPSGFAQSSSSILDVTVSLASSPSSPLAQLQIAVGSMGNEASFSLSSLPPSTTPYNLSCSASLSSNSQSTFTTQALLRRLPPNPYQGSVTKIDRRTGSMLRQSASGEWEPTLTFGFYTGFDSLASNLSLVDQMKADGLNTIHLIPPYDNVTALASILDKADSVGVSVRPTCCLTASNCIRPSDIVHGGLQGHISELVCCVSLR
jgi:hypothetical protein